MKWNNKQLRKIRKRQSESFEQSLQSSERQRALLTLSKILVKP
jgi:hypothetical protein